MDFFCKVSHLPRSASTTRSEQDREGERFGGNYYWGWRFHMAGDFDCVWLGRGELGGVGGGGS